MALSDNGELLAAHAMDSWSFDRDPGDTPTFVHLLGHAEEEAAVALLNHDLRASGAATVDARLVSDADAPAELRTLREGQQRVLEAARFAVEVDRIRLHWTKPSGPGPVLPQPRRAGRLTFRPATSLPKDDLVEIFATDEVGDRAAQPKAVFHMSCWV